VPEEILVGVGVVGLVVRDVGHKWWLMLTVSPKVVATEERTLLGENVQDQLHDVVKAAAARNERRDIAGGRWVSL